VIYLLFDCLSILRSFIFILLTFALVLLHIISFIQKRCRYAENHFKQKIKLSSIIYHVSLNIMVSYHRLSCKIVFCVDWTYVFPFILNKTPLFPYCIEKGLKKACFWAKIAPLYFCIICKKNICIFLLFLSI